MSVPMGLLIACVRQLPRLQAEETLLGAQATALGSGAMKPADARTAHERLYRIATNGHAQRRQQASPSVLASMGVAVVVTAKDETRDGH